MKESMAGMRFRGEAFIDEADSRFFALMKRHDIEANDWTSDDYDDSVEVICPDEANAMKLAALAQELLPKIGSRQIWVHVGASWGEKRQVAHVVFGPQSPDPERGPK